MKILSAQQIREADAFTIKEQQIHSSELMERASKVFSNWFILHFNFFESIQIFCGVGNNGGDGLCIARHLHLNGKKVLVIIVGDLNKASDDFKINYSRLQKFGAENIKLFDHNNLLPTTDCDCILDCIFGTGLNKTPEGIYAAAIEQINKQDAFKIAVDIPSGLFADIPSNHICVEADITFSFEFPKLSFFFPENKKYTGEWIIKSIGLSQNFISLCETKFHFLTEENIDGIIQARKTFSHKGSYGHALIIAGSEGMSGAAQLCGLSCLTTGAGLVTISADQSSLEHPELMTIPFQLIPEQIEKDKYNVLGIGPGLGTNKESTELVKNILSIISYPIVLDADALNCLAQNKNLLELLPQNSILTPHPKEFERLFGAYNSWDELLMLLTEKTKKYNCIIVYKRAYTIIVSPAGEIYFNSTGNAGMATAGSGDVLTGIITALLAQKYRPSDAAILGVYLHGLSGDLALLETNGQNLIATDLISHLQNAFSLILGD